METNIDKAYNLFDNHYLSGEKKLVLDCCEEIFLKRITITQKEILKYRRDGLKIKDIAILFGKSHAWVHRQIKMAKVTASKAFGVSYT